MREILLVWITSYIIAGSESTAPPGNHICVVQYDDRIHQKHVAPGPLSARSCPTMSTPRAISYQAVLTATEMRNRNQLMCESWSTRN